MAHKILTHLDLGLNNLLNVKIDPVSALPAFSAAHKGRLVFLTTDGKLYVNDGVSYASVTPDIGQGSNLTLSGNLTVKGNTILGDPSDGTADTTTIKGVATIISGATKALANAANSVFKIKTSDSVDLFDVRENGDTIIAGTLKVNGTTGTFGDGVTPTDLTIKGNLTVQGNTNLGDDQTTDLVNIKAKKVEMIAPNDKSKWTTREVKNAETGVITRYYRYDNGTESLTPPPTIFKIRDSATSANTLFEVLENGDTIIGGILRVNGDGTSEFAGDVSIGGHLTVMEGATVKGTFSGDTFTIEQNLLVKGNTTLGDDVANDLVEAKVKEFKIKTNNDSRLWTTREVKDVAGKLTAQMASGVKTAVVNNVNDWAVGMRTRIGTQLFVIESINVATNTLTFVTASTQIYSIDSAVTQDGILRYYRYNGGTETITPPPSIFYIEDSGTRGGSLDGTPTGIPSKIFEVLENGDTIIGGVLRVNGDGTSEFKGDVKIGGNLEVLGNATVKGIMSGEDFRITGNLLVDGNTTLGNNAEFDYVTLNSRLTTINTYGKINDANAKDISVFKILDSTTAGNGGPKALFDVRQNGDTVIAGTLTIQGGSNGGGSGDPSVGISANLDMKDYKIINLGTPTQAKDAVNKAYVDGLVQGLDVKASVKAATTAALPSCVYVAAVFNTISRNQITTPSTLTASANGAFTIATINETGSVTFAVGDRILVKNQVDTKQNGIYEITNLGGASAKWVLTRANDFDRTMPEYADDAKTIVFKAINITAGAYVLVSEGDTNKETGWVLSTNDTIVLDNATTGLLSFTQFSGVGSVQAGNGLESSGNKLYVNPSEFIEATHGLTTNGSGESMKLRVSLDAAGGLVFNSGAIKVNAGDGIQLAGTGNNFVTIKLSGTTLSNSTAGLKVSDTYPGNASLVTLGTVTTGTWNATTVGVGYGGTGLSTYTIGSMLYASATTTLTQISPNTTATKQFLNQTSSGAPVWSALADADIPNTLGATAGTRKTINGLSFVANATGFSISGGTTSKTLTISDSVTISGGGKTITMTQDLTNNGTGAITLKGAGTTLTLTKDLETTGGKTTLTSSAGGNTLTLNYNLTVSGANKTIQGAGGTIDIGGNLTTSNAVSFASGTNAVTLNFNSTASNPTTLTFPTSGTVLTTANMAASGYPKKYSADIGGGVVANGEVTITITHNLGTEEVAITLYENATKQVVYADAFVVDANTIKIVKTGTTTVPASTYKVVIIG